MCTFVLFLQSPESLVLKGLPLACPSPSEEEALRLAEEKPPRVRA